MAGKLCKLAKQTACDPNGVKAGQMIYWSIQGVCHERNLVHCHHNEIRNPNWIQKSTLKSENPIWNLEIQSKNDSGSIKILLKCSYTFKLITSLDLHMQTFGRPASRGPWIIYDVTAITHTKWPCSWPIFSLVLRSFFQGDVIVCQMLSMHILCSA